MARHKTIVELTNLIYELTNDFAWIHERISWTRNLNNVHLICVGISPMSSPHQIENFWRGFITWKFDSRFLYTLWGIRTCTYSSIWRRNETFPRESHSKISTTEETIVFRSSQRTCDFPHRMSAMSMPIYAISKIIMQKCSSFVASIRIDFCFWTLLFSTGAYGPFRSCFMFSLDDFAGNHGSKSIKCNPMRAYVNQIHAPTQIAHMHAATPRDNKNRSSSKGVKWKQNIFLKLSASYCHPPHTTHRIMPVER